MATPQNMIVDNYWLEQAAVVTGGARGQGASIAKMLLCAGAHVHVMDRLAAGDVAWRDLRDFSEGQPGTLTGLGLDVAQPQSWAVVAEKIQTGKRALRGLVNNAGITGPRNTVTKGMGRAIDRAGFHGAA